MLILEMHANNIQKLVKKSLFILNENNYNNNKYITIKFNII